MNKLYSVRDAAGYLGLAAVTIKYHLYHVKDLVPDGTFGKSLYFTQGTLDQFALRKRAAHRPRKSPVAPCGCHPHSAPEAATKAIASEPAAAGEGEGGTF